jgi:hypothetical protein
MHALAGDLSAALDDCNLATQLKALDLLAEPVIISNEAVGAPPGVAASFNFAAATWVFAHLCPSKTSSVVARLAQNTAVTRVGWLTSN